MLSYHLLAEHQHRNLCFYSLLLFLLPLVCSLSPFIRFCICYIARNSMLIHKFFSHSHKYTRARSMQHIFSLSLSLFMDAFVHSSIIRDSRSSFTLLLVLSLFFSHIFWIVCVYRIICHSFSALSVSVEGELNLYRFHIVYTVKLFGIYDFVHFFHFFFHRNKMTFFMTFAFVCSTFFKAFLLRFHFQNSPFLFN